MGSTKTKKADEMAQSIILIADYLRREFEREDQLEREACADGRTGLRDAAYERKCAYRNAYSYVMGVMDFHGIQI